MLVSATEMLKKAKAGHYAVGQFNINNLEWTKSILLTAEELKSPVILGVSEGAGKYMTGYKTVVGMVNGMMEELGITVPVALHLDHGSFEGAKETIAAGFSSVMFDGSHYPFEEWNHFFSGAIHLHGHQHNLSDYNYKMKLKGLKRYDVGVDANQFKPVNIEEIIEFIEK